MKYKLIFQYFYKYFLGVLNGPDIRKLMKSEKFNELLLPTERNAWNGIKDVVQNFLGNKRAPNYRDIVQKTLAAFEKMNVHMSLKIHLLKEHLEFYRENLGKVSDEHGERFHQQIKHIEKRFEGKMEANMLAEYIWEIAVEQEEETEEMTAEQETEEMEID